MSRDLPALSKPWYLKQIHLFSGLSEADLQELEQLTKMFTVKKGEFIYLSGDPANTVYLLKKGRIKTVMTGQGGKELTFEVLQPGEIFGDLDVSPTSTRKLRAEAREDSLLCSLPREDFERYLSRHSRLVVSLLELIRRRFRKLRSQVEDLAYREVPARLAHFLLDLSQTEGVPDGRVIHIRVKLTHQEMANLIGCSRETVSTTLGRFQREGLIRIDNHSITILNSDGLSRLVP